jgi:hypothetical protein
MTSNPTSPREILRGSAVTTGSQYALLNTFLRSANRSLASESSIRASTIATRTLCTLSFRSTRFAASPFSFLGANRSSILASSKVASAARAFAFAVSSRISSSSLSWIVWSFLDASRTQPETKVSITTPTITNFAPSPFHPSSHSPAATRRPPTIDAVSSADSIRSQRCLILIVAMLFVANKVAALIVERWR